MAEGDLTMHGVTRRITLPFAFTQRPIRSPESRWMVLNVAGSERLARADFGIVGGSTHNPWFNAARAATMGGAGDGVGEAGKVRVGRGEVRWGSNVTVPGGLTRHRSPTDVHCFLSFISSSRSGTKSRAA
jgi:hypothetical protein